MPARITLFDILDMAAERGGAAVADRLESFSLMRTEHGPHCAKNSFS